MNLLNSMKELWKNSNKTLDAIVDDFLYILHPFVMSSQVYITFRMHSFYSLKQTYLPPLTRNESDEERTNSIPIDPNVKFFFKK